MQSHSFIKYSTLSLSLLIFSVAAQISNAEYFEVAPEVTQWKESMCKSGGYTCEVRAYCYAAGGTPVGNCYNQECPGADYDAWHALPATEKVSTFSFYNYNLCAAPQVSFTGYGFPAHDTYNCWSPTVKYSLGVEIWTTGSMVMSGTTGSDCTTPVSVEFSALRTRTASCPAGSVSRDECNGQRCYIQCPAGKILIDNICRFPKVKDDGCTGINGNGAGNPCNVATGNKYQQETDFSSSGLTFTRSYNSRNLAELGLGKGWRSNYQKTLVIAADSLTQFSGTGRGEPWSKVNGTWQGDADSDVIITETASGFQLTRANGVVEHYNANGALLSSTDTNGHQTSYAYNASNQLTSVTNHYGHSIAFSYSGEAVSSVTDSLGAVYGYEYDANNNLISVVLPDTTPNDTTDNPKKTYHYENASFPSHLTGITDENGDRYATYAYDANGKAISTEHSQTSNAVGQEKFELDYQSGD